MTRRIKVTIERGDPYIGPAWEHSGDTPAPTSRDTTIPPGMIRLNDALVCSTCRGIGVVQTTPGHLIRRGSSAKWINCKACGSAA